MSGGATAISNEQEISEIRFKSGKYREVYIENTERFLLYEIRETLPKLLVVEKTSPNKNL